MLLHRSLPATAGRLKPCALGLLLLAIAPALQAGERLTPPPSPYRLAINSESAGSLDNSPYLLDQRYREFSAPAAQLPEKPFARQIDVAAREAGVDPALVHAVISIESAYRATAISPKGAVGLMQVLPETALRYGVSDPAKVTDNLRAGARHLRSLLDRYDERLDLVLAAYNAGEGAVKRYHNTIPPYAETRHYVPAVIAKYEAGGKRPTHKKPVKAATHEYLAGTRLDSVDANSQITSLTRLR